MGRTHTPLELDALLAEAGRLRALAASLVLDPAAAEDVAQDAALALLRRPPPRDRPLRAWLARVMANRARELHRGERAREHRQRAVAAREALPSSAELVERTELQRELVGAVLALDEPGRSTLILHGIDGVPLAELARARGLPPATVRSQLFRARAEVRRRLEARYGERAGSLLGLLALPAPPPAAAALVPLVPGWLMMKTVVLGAAVTAGALAVWIGLAMWDAGDPPAEGPVVVAPEVAEPSGADARGGAAGGDERRPAPAVSGPEADAVVAPEAAPAEPPPPAIADWSTWSRVDALALATFDGDVQLADAYALALELLADADAAGGAWSENGTRQHELFEDAHRRATLDVRPGAAGEFGGFLLTLETDSAMGTRGDPEGADGARLELRFGVKDGAISSVGSWSQVRFAGEPRDSAPAEGDLQIGAFLQVDSRGVNWRPQLLDRAPDETGIVTGRMRFATPRSFPVGALADGRAAELAELLERFRIE